MMRRAMGFVLMTVLVLGAYGSARAATATAAERDSLIYMREEEKLARDVYLALAEQWRLPIFTNIAAAEQVHMDRVLGLLNKYGVPDPAADLGQGEFTNPVFTDLYDELTAAGSVSLVEALRVGVFVEETDIGDLTRFLTQVRPRDIRNVYTNLLSASYHHLTAFNRMLRRQ